MSASPDVGMPDAPLDAPVTRSFGLSVLGYLGTLAFVMGGGILCANRFHTDTSGTCAIFGGFALLVVTLLRPAFLMTNTSMAQPVRLPYPLSP